MRNRSGIARYSVYSNDFKTTSFHNFGAHFHNERHIFRKRRLKTNARYSQFHTVENVSYKSNKIYWLAIFQRSFESSATRRQLCRWRRRRTGLSMHFSELLGNPSLPCFSFRRWRQRFNSLTWLPSLVHR